MDDPQEFRSLDDLFRKTFENLPETPAASGWDKPSPQVWEQVRTQIPTPRHGWTGQAVLLISGLAVVVMLGLYWALMQPSLPSDEAPPTTEQPATQEQSAAVATEQNESQLNTEATASQALLPTPPNQTAKPAASSTSNQHSNSAQREDENAQHRPAGSALLPGANPIAPNTTVRRQLDTWRGAPWAQPLNPLPTILERPILRPVPEILKNLEKN